MSMKKLAIVFILSIVAVVAGFSISCSSTSTPAPTMDMTLGYLQIYVTDSNDAPLVGAKVVSQTQPDGQLKVNGLTDKDGLVTFTGIKAGNYEFAISQADSKPTLAAVNLAAGQPIAITIKLEKATTP
jgi:hypothetical protein